MSTLNQIYATTPERDDAESSTKFLNYKMPRYKEFMSKLHDSVQQVDLKSLKDIFDKIMSTSTVKMTHYGLALLSLFYRLYRLETMADLFFAGLDFLKSTLGVNYIINSATDVYKFLRGRIAHIYNRIVSCPTVFTEVNVKDSLVDLKSKFSLVLGSELVTSVRDFVLSLVSMKVFSKDINKNISSVLGPAKACSGFEMVEVVLNASIALLSAGDKLASGASLGEIFGTTDPIATFLSLSDELEALKDLTYSGIPVPDKVCRRDYLKRVVDAVRDGSQILDSLPKASHQRRGIEFALKKMKLIKAQFTNMMTAESRPMPFALCAEGMPGIGKGTLVDYFSMVWSHVKGRIFDPSHVYHRQATEEYWSGYEPLSKPIIHYSEPGSLNRNIAKSRGDPVMTEFLSVADNQPYMCNMADVESKGRVFALPEFLIMDCNDPTMNLDVLVNNPAAVRRRILYVTPTVKSEFRKEGTCRMDQAASLASEVPILDRWNFSVYRLEPQDNKNSNTIVLLSNVDVYELTQFLISEFTLHIKQQEARVDMLKGVRVTDYLERPEEPHTEGYCSTCSYEPSSDRDNDFEFDELDSIGSNILSDASSEYAMSEGAVTIIEEESLPFMYYQLWFLECFFEAFWYFSCTLYQCVYISAICALMSIIWFLPFGYLKTFITLRALYSRLSYRRDVADYWWNMTKSACGLPNTYVRPKPQNYNVAMYVAGFLGVLTLWKGYRAVTVFTEGSVLSTAKNRSEEEVDSELERIQEASGCQLPPERKKRGNGIDWDATQDMRPIPVPIDHQNQLKPAEEIMNAVSKNVRFLVCEGAKNLETKAWGIFGDFAIVNRHSLSHPRDDGTWNVIVSMDKEGTIGVKRVTITLSEVEECNGDLFLIRLRGLKFRDCRSFVTTKRVQTAIYGNVGFVNGEKVLVKDHVPLVAQDKYWGPTPLHTPYSYENNHSRGMCGTPVICEYSGGRGVIGIHSAGTNFAKAYAESICMEQILEACKSLMNRTCTLPVMSEGLIRLPISVKGIVGVSERSPIRFEPCPGLEVYGKLDGYTPMKPGRSRLCSSDFVHCAEELTGVSPFDTDGKPLFAAPPMTHRIVNGVYKAPYNHFTRKAGVIKKSLHPEILKETIKIVSNHILAGLTARDVNFIRPVTIEVAQNGFPKDFYMRAMKPSTSGGWAWPGAKKKYSRQCCLDFKQDSYMPLFDVKEQVLEQLSAYEQGRDALPLLGAQLKDEPRAFQKVVDAKTRVFCMSPYESTLVNRMYLMPFYTLMVEHSDLFNVAVGINMHSTDVDDLVKSFLDFADEFMEGDYGGFDTSMPYDIGLAANTVVYNCCKALGYDSYALQMVQGILSDNLYPTVVMQGDVFAAPALQPSGKYATAEDNSLRGLIMLVYAWNVLCTPLGAQYAKDENLIDQFRPDQFWEFILAVIYGDDMLAGVKEEAKPFFNNVTYQGICERVYGLEFTNAQKTLKMKKFLRFDEVSFLKRNFVFREDLDHWVAPIDRSSIMKSICYYLPSKSVSLADQMIDSCVSALRELFFHTCEEDYDALRIKFSHRCAEYYGRDAGDILKMFPRFDAIREALYGKEVPFMVDDGVVNQILL